jgi:hypothetical protein
MATTRVEGYRQQYRLAHQWLEGTLDGMTGEQVNFQPGGNALPAGAQYSHHVQGLDGIFNGKLGGKAPLMTGAFAGKFGTSESAPLGDWAAWARSAEVDLDAARAYAGAVYEATDAYLAGLTDSDLDGTVDLSMWGMGDQPLSHLLNVMLLDAAVHTGEISAIKGMQGLKGYPF